MDTIDNVCERLITRCHTVCRSDMSILPDGCKYYCDIPWCGKVFVIEQKPQVRTVEINELGNNPHICIGDHQIPSCLHWRELASIYHTYRLAFPYVIFIITINNCDFIMQVYFRNTPLNSTDDSLGKTNLPNVRTDHESVCLGSDLDLKGITSLERVHYLLSYFWNSKFSCDYMYNFVLAGHKNPSLKTVKTWAEATKKNPNFILDIEWTHMHYLCNLMNLKYRLAFDWVTDINL